MAWKPVHRESQETVWHRLIARGTMLVLGLALLYGAWACASTAIDIRRDIREWGEEYGSRSSHRHNASGTGLFWLGAAACGLPGTMLTLFGIVPASAYEKLGASFLN